MKLLIVSTTSFYGGGESFIVNTLTQLYSNTQYIVNNKKLINILPKNKTIIFAKKTLYGQLIQLKQFIKTHSIDTVILNGGSSIYFAPFLSGIKIIIYRHTTNKAIDNLFKRFIYSIILHFCYLYANSIITVSRYALKEQLILRDKAYCIYHGINPLPINQRETHKPLRLLFIGRLEKSKGIDTIIKAIKLLDPNDVILEIVGEGELSQYIKNLKLKNIIYNGFRDNVSLFYERCDVFISLPKHEAFGLTILEAMNFSMPIISCDTGAITELVHNSINGFIVDPDPIKVSKIIELFIKNKSLVNKMGGKSNQICRDHFNKEATISKIKEIINL